MFAVLNGGSRFTGGIRPSPLLYISEGGGCEGRAMLYLLRAAGLGSVLMFSSEGCFREEALRALAFIAMPVARTGGGRVDFTRGDDGVDAAVDAKGVGIVLVSAAGRVEAFTGGGGGTEAETAFGAVFVGAAIVLRAFSIIGMIVFLEAGFIAATLSDISPKPIRDTMKGNKACAAFLTSALRSSTEANVTGIKGERSSPGGAASFCS